MSPSRSHADATGCDRANIFARRRLRHADEAAAQLPRPVDDGGGVFAGAGPNSTLIDLVHTLLGTFLVAGGAAALNQVWERQTDWLMRRTRTRPLADMRMTAAQGAIFGFPADNGRAPLSSLTSLNPLSADGRGC